MRGCLRGRVGSFWPVCQQLVFGIKLLVGIEPGEVIKGRIGVVKDKWGNGLNTVVLLPEVKGGTKVFGSSGGGEIKVIFDLSFTVWPAGFSDKNRIGVV